MWPVSAGGMIKIILFLRLYLPSYWLLALFSLYDYRHKFYLLILYYENGGIAVKLDAWLLDIPSFQSAVAHVGVPENVVLFPLYWLFICREWRDEFSVLDVICILSQYGDLQVWIIPSMLRGYRS